jgi:hypothetical protein
MQLCKVTNINNFLFPSYHSDTDRLVPACKILDHFLQVHGFEEGKPPEIGIQVHLLIGLNLWGGVLGGLCDY